MEDRQEEYGMREDEDKWGVLTCGGTARLAKAFRSPRWHPALSAARFNGAPITNKPRFGNLYDLERQSRVVCICTDDAVLTLDVRKMRDEKMDWVACHITNYVFVSIRSLSFFLQNRKTG